MKTSIIERAYLEAKGNRWMNYFSIFLRFALAFGFITSGIVKIVGERFAAGLSINHPMGQYLEALHHTGFYYTFIGLAQVVAALLLLFPRTVALGAVIYFPIIFNIFVLSYALRFEGSSVTSPLMVLGCLFLICWNYDRVRYLLPIKVDATTKTAVKQSLSNKFPVKFFLFLGSVIGSIILFQIYGFDIVPRNSEKDCNLQFEGTNRTQAGAKFCECIHRKGMPLDQSIQQYERTPNDSKK